MIRKTIFRALGSVLAFALISGCGEQTPEATTDPEPAAAAVVESTAAAVSIYEAAVATATRPEEDRASDEGRKPAQVLEFAGIEPGMTVLDMFSGSGWYAEIIAHVVGDSGHVIAHSNEVYKKFVGESLAERFAGGRVPNTEILMAENNHLTLEENSLDAVMLGLSFHDIYNENAEYGWVLLDGPAFLAELKKGLRPGGIVAVVDHKAEAGAPAETGNTLHRIDPAIVVADMEAAGFVCEAISDMLSNPHDDLAQSVFTEGIRGKTDRMVMRFRNPE